MSNEPTALHQQHRHAPVENTTGMPQQCVWFVGAGPGVADLLTAVEDWCRPKGPLDDVTILGVEWKP